MTTKMKKELIGLFIICFGLAQCTTKKSDIGAEKDEDYKSFIKTFNEDTVFQKNRVKYKFEDKFNLSISNVDTKLFDISTVESDSVVVKMTLRTDTTYWVKYIFKKDGSKWYLTDYVDTYRE
jgi:starvation-inducible outer membrane lipoprotein